MTTVISIKFDQNDYGVYYSGQVVSGKVEISCSKVKKIRGIALKIMGYAKCHWTESRTTGTGRNRQTHTVSYSGREDYIASTTYLVGSEFGGTIEVLPGIHTYHFACALPSVTPSSFEGSTGYIRYLAKVILDRPWKFDQTYTVGFTVIKPLDLNYDSPVLRIPAEIEATKTLWCGLCSKSGVHLKASVMQTGFVPGQVILIKTEVDNNSNVTVKDVKFYLRKQVAYTSQTPAVKAKFEETNVVTRSAGAVKKRSVRKFEESLLVPPVPPTSIINSRVIQITYDIVITAKLSGAHHNATMSIPITIGTVPLMGNMQQQMSFPAVTSDYPQPNAPHPEDSTEFECRKDNTLPVIAPITNPEPTTPNFNLPPPTYQEAIDMVKAQVDEGEKHSLQKNYFTPRYPVYNFEDFVPTAPKITDLDDDSDIGNMPP